MTEEYILKSKKLFSKEEISKIQEQSGKGYNLGEPTWHDGESLDKNGWYYQLTSNQELSIPDLDIIKEKGLTLLLTGDQVARLMKKRPLRSFDILGNYPIEIVDSVPKGTGTGGNI